MKFEEEFFEKERVKNTIGWCYFLSILFHVCFFTIHFLNLSKQDTRPTDSLPIEITDIPKSQLHEMDQRIKQKIKQNHQEKQIVESEKTHNNEIDETTKYLSDKNQKVEKQTRANKVDDFQERKGTGPKEQKTAESDTSKDAVSSDIGLTETKGQKKDWKALSLQDLSVGNGDGGKTAASDDKLEGVDRGENTMLSTREFKYFGYYHRIKELLRQHWKPEVEHQIERIWRKGRQISSNELTTKVLVTLNDKGKLTKISKLEGSGFSEIDEAAIEAFQRAAPFPNPPHAMVEEDGFVRIRWDFVLTADSGPRIQFRNAGSDPRY